MTTENEPKKLRPLDLITPEVRLAFPKLFRPAPKARGSDLLTYQAVLLLPPSVDLAPFKEKIRAAALEKFGPGVKLAAGKNPIRPCDEKDIEGYLPGWHYINLHSKYAPGIVDARNVPITDESKIYAGCWVKAYLNAFAWNHTVGGKGVSFGLNAIQFIRHDERLDGRVSASDVFAPIDTVEEDAAGDDSTDDMFA